MAHPATTLSIRVPEKIRKQLEDLANATGRTKSFHAAEAIEQYLVVQDWQVKGIEQAVKKANSKEAQFVEHEKVVEWLSSWGNADEKEPPK